MKRTVPLTVPGQRNSQTYLPSEASSADSSNDWRSSAVTVLLPSESEGAAVGAVRSIVMRPTTGEGNSTRSLRIGRPHRLRPVGTWMRMTWHWWMKFIVIALSDARPGRPVRGSASM